MATKCPKCHAENPETVKFCGECGTQLGSVEEFSLFQTETLETSPKELATGSTFAGRYQIIEELGKGGMGKVYKVLDTHINEKVALKLLKPEIAADRKTIERFSNELKFARKIRHKNVCGMYDLGREAGNFFITMEYVSGEDLKSFIRRARQLVVGTAVLIAKEICEGLAEAHRVGVVHRDLKPGNIMIDKEGNAKIMDFGIARSVSVKGITGAGVMIGTPEYMSPEQVEGKEVDARSDIYSLGIILYEMLTGLVPFEGDTPFTIGMKQKSEIPKDPKSLNAQIPQDLSRLILKCLEKDKEKRFQNADELRDSLAKIEKGIPTAERPVPKIKTVKSKPITMTISRKKLFAPLSIFFAIALSGIGLWRLLSKHPVVPPKLPQTVQRLSIRLQAKEPLAPVGLAPLGVGRPALALTPDGSKLVYVGEREDGTALYLRPLDSENAQVLPGTEGAYNPFFSPDGLWVGFFSGNQLKKIPVAGGQPVTLCEATNTYGATWADDGKIYFGPKEGLNLSRISSEGGVPEMVLEADASKGSRVHWPECLPGGRGILFSNGILSLATRELKALSGVLNPRYLSTGHLLYSRPGGLVAVPFDIERLEVTGAPVPVLDGIRTETFGAAQYAISNDGLLIFVPGESAAVARPAWVDRNGKLETLPFRADRYGSFRISPDGTKLAISILGATNHIWILDLIGKGEPQRFSTDDNELSPVWSPDGTHLAFMAMDNGNLSIFWRPADRSQERERLISRGNRIVPESWSPDGQLLAIAEQTPGGFDISIFSLKTRELQPFLASRFNEGGPAFSPDGRWIAYTSDESGQYEVYVQPWPVTGGKWQVSITSGGNEEPVWSKDGRELFYRNGRRWMAVPISTSPTFSAGAPQLLFQGDYINVSGLEYGVSPDGKRFLVLQPEDISPPIELHVVINWFEELKRLVPTEKK